MFFVPTQGFEIGFAFMRKCMFPPKYDTLCHAVCFKLGFFSIAFNVWNVKL